MLAFFIVGSARSGTTLLRMILNAHPELVVPPESRFVVELHRGRDTVDVDTFLSELGHHRRWAAWDLPIAGVQHELQGRTKVPYPVAIEAAYSAYARTRGKKIAGDKTPRYIENIPLLARLFPSARFIHQVRDGRNVALSYADVPFGPKTVGRAAELWRRRVAAGLTDGRALGDDKYLELRYEDLVTATEPQLIRLCDFLGVTFDPAMLDYTERSRSEVLVRAQRYNPNVTEPPKAQVRSWQQEMPERQARIFEAVAGPLLAELGYERRWPDPGVVARVEASLARRGLPIGRLKSSGPR